MYHFGSKLKHNKARNSIGLILGVPFILVGVQHFAQPEIFIEIVPDYLGWPSFWNYTSGSMEMLFGVGLMVPFTRVFSARLLVILVLLMSLANLNMWINDLPFNGHRLSTTGHIIRWFIQFILIAVLLWLGEIIGKKSRVLE
jgi:uncharacterized membrane protein